MTQNDDYILGLINAEGYKKGVLKNFNINISFGVFEFKNLDLISC